MTVATIYDFWFPTFPWLQIIVISNVFAWNHNIANYASVWGYKQDANIAEQLGMILTLGIEAIVIKYWCTSSCSPFLSKSWKCKRVKGKMLNKNYNQHHSLSTLHISLKTKTTIETAAVAKSVMRSTSHEFLGITITWTNNEICGIITKPFMKWCNIIG